MKLKLLFLISVSLVTTSIATQAQGIPFNPVVEAAGKEVAQQKANSADSLSRMTKAELSKGGAGNPFRLTVEEINSGITFYGEGVYSFPSDGENGPVKYAFLLANFLKVHKQLEVTSQATYVQRKSESSWAYGISTAYIVTFREKEKK